MYVRVEGRRIETCPISGTIRRGADPLEDADRILELLNSKKDESELTMCTDVDRNDKSRVCVAGSVKVIGRRQIEMYSRLIHTVDHVEGMLRPEFDALDGFLSHTWAVTVTGAPKLWAIRFIEEQERSARRWYGGAIGRLTFDGNMNTGLTLRTIRMQDGIGEVRAGATLLFDSDPVGEDEECRLKASALFAAIAGNRAPPPVAVAATPRSGAGRKVLLVDHEDSFVHTLAGYVRQTGAECTTLRHDFARAELADGPTPDLVVLSPGPGRPDDFAMRETLDLLLSRRIPIFGVCLGLQGIVEYFGGALDVLAVPMHGKPSVIRASDNRLFSGLPGEFTVGRYHSLHARKAQRASGGTLDRRRDVGRRDHGDRTQDPADRRGAVSSRIDHDLAQHGRHADHRRDVVELVRRADEVASRNRSTSFRGGFRLHSEGQLVAVGIGNVEIPHPISVILGRLNHAGAPRATELPGMQGIDLSFTKIRIRRRSLEPSWACVLLSRCRLKTSSRQNRL